MTEDLLGLSGHVPKSVTHELRGNQLVRWVPLDGGIITSSIRLGAGLRPSIRESLPGLWWKLRMVGHQPIAAEPTRQQLRAVDLFCGIGGLSVGLRLLAEEAGARVVVALAADTDMDATAVYSRNHTTRVTSNQSVSSLVDYRLRGSDSESNFVYPPAIIDDEVAATCEGVDLVMAGPPCQGHSNLNNHSRRTDKRNHLYLNVPAFAVACGAKAVLIENVSSVVHDEAQVVNATKALLTDNGYSVDDGVLSASAMGWPQTRRRHFLVARLTSTGPAIPLAKIADALMLEAPLTLDWAVGAGETLSADPALHEQPDYSAQNKTRIQYLFDHDEHDLPNEERPDCHRDGTSYGSVYGRMRHDQPAPTITTGFMTPGRGRFIHPTKPRTLTPAEAARLQGFPDDYVFRVKPELAPKRSQLAKWIGDAVPMPLGYAASLAAVGPDLFSDLD